MAPTTTLFSPPGKNIFHPFFFPLCNLTLLGHIKNIVFLFWWLAMVPGWAKVVHLLWHVVDNFGHFFHHLTPLPHQWFWACLKGLLLNYISAFIPWKKNQNPGRGGLPKSGWPKCHVLWPVWVPSPSSSLCPAYPTPPTGFLGAVLVHPITLQWDTLLWFGPQWDILPKSGHCTSLYIALQ